MDILVYIIMQGNLRFPPQTPFPYSEIYERKYVTMKHIQKREGGEWGKP